MYIYLILKKINWRVCYIPVAGLLSNILFTSIVLDTLLFVVKYFRIVQKPCDCMNVGCAETM